MIRMLLTSYTDALDRPTYLIGNRCIVESMPQTPAMRLFDERVVTFLDAVAKRLLKDAQAKQYPDIVTFAFWIRRASSRQLALRFLGAGEDLRIGKGVVFHIAPSNVPVNFAYSLAAGLLCGNANIVRIPSKSFPQIDYIVQALEDSLAEYSHMSPYLALVRYERTREINDVFSAIANVRVVWGGDATIIEVRKSPLPPRSTEVTFADRFSMAVIDSDAYCNLEDKQRVAIAFYNDTYLSDQNACTSPCAIAWMGSRIEEAKHVFWETVHQVVKGRYKLQPIVSVNKLTRVYLASVALPGCRMEPSEDNLIVRVHVPVAHPALADLRESCGFFYEMECEDVLELQSLCGDIRCQTIAYVGDRKAILPLVHTGVRGIDRIVPLGKTMDFDLIWDGYRLTDALTRTVGLR